MTAQEVAYTADGAELGGSLTFVPGASGIVVFAHGSGSSRFSPRNRQVAAALNDAGLATLLIDLLTAHEERVDRATAALRFDIPLLAQRLVSASEWLSRQPELARLSVGYFGASTGAAAALIAAAERPETRAVVSRGGRPDLAGDALARVQAPTLLIVGEHDPQVLELNRSALAALGPQQKELVVVPGATHLFEEPGALDEVTRLARTWFERHLTPDAGVGSRRDGRGLQVRERDVPAPRSRQRARQGAAAAQARRARGRGLARGRARRGTHRARADEGRGARAPGGHAAGWLRVRRVGTAARVPRGARRQSGTLRVKSQRQPPRSGGLQGFWRGADPRERIRALRS